MLLSWLQITEARWPWQPSDFIYWSKAGVRPLGARTDNLPLPAIQNRAHHSKSTRTHHRHHWDAGKGNNSGNFNQILPFTISPQKAQDSSDTQHLTELASKFVTFSGPVSKTTWTRNCKVQPLPRNDWHLWLNSLPTLLRVAWQQYLCNAEEPALLIRSSMASMIAASCPPLLCRYTPSQLNSITGHKRSQHELPNAGGNIRAEKHHGWPGQIWKKPAITFAPTRRSHVCHK